MRTTRGMKAWTDCAPPDRSGGEPGSPHRVGLRWGWPVHCAGARPSGQRPRRGQRHEGYHFWAFIHAHRRRVAKEQRIQYVESVEAIEKPDDSWASMLENEIQLNELLGYLDPKAREMLMGRIAGHSWKEIGESMGLTAHNAEVQFAYAIKKARRRLFGGAPDKSGQGER